MQHSLRGIYIYTGEVYCQAINSINTVRYSLRLILLVLDQFLTGLDQIQLNQQPIHAR